MAEHFRFFNSTENDIREYRADEFAEYFGLFLSDGLFSVDGKAGLKVSNGIGMQVNIDPGYAFIRGYMYKNDSTLPLIINAADQNLNRIDRVVIRYDEVARNIRTIVKKGMPASTPQAPVLEITDTVKELSIAQIKVNKGIVSITSADIIDERFTSKCGLVNSLITVPTEEMWDVWNGTLVNIQKAWNDWFTGRQNDLGIRVTTGSAEPNNVVSGDLWLKELT